MCSPLVQFESTLSYETLEGFLTPRARGGPAALLVLVLEAAEAFGEGALVHVTEVAPTRSFEVDREEEGLVHVVLTPAGQESCQLSVYASVSCGGGQPSWDEVLHAQLNVGEDHPDAQVLPAFGDEPPTSLWRTPSVHAIRVGVVAGPEGWWARFALWRREDPVPRPLEPAILRSLAMLAGQCVLEQLPAGVPCIVGWSEAWWGAMCPDEVVAHLSQVRTTGAELVFDARILDLKGRLVADLRNVEVDWIEPPESLPGGLGPEEVLQQVLEATTTPAIAALGDEEDLYAAGLDSLMLVATARELGQRMGREAGGVLADFLRTSPVGKGALTRKDLLAVLGHDPSLRTSLASGIEDTSWPSRTEPATALEVLEGRYGDVFGHQTLKVERWLAAGGIELEAISLGNGGRLAVFLPPLGCEVAAWAATMERLSETHRVVAVNFPGYGHSPLRQDIPRLAPVARAVLSLMRAWSPEDSVDLVGWSLGGFVAQLLAARVPECVHRLVLVNTTDCLFPSEASIADQEATLHRMDTDLRRSLAALQPPAASVARQRVFYGRESRSPLAIQHQNELVVAYDHREQSSRIRASTLIVAGSDDFAVPPFHARRMEAQIEGSRLVILSGAGHYIPLFQPDALWEHLWSHLRESDA